MRIYLKAGHDIETASQMMTAMSHLAEWLESAWQWAVRNVPTAKSTPEKWEGVLVSLITLHTPTKECCCGERMELGPVNFYLSVVSVHKVVAFFLSWTRIQIMRFPRFLFKPSKLEEARKKKQQQYQQNWQRLQQAFANSVVLQEREWQRRRNLWKGRRLLYFPKHPDWCKNKYALEQETLYNKAMTQVN